MLSTNPSMGKSTPRVVYPGLTQGRLPVPIPEVTTRPQAMQHCYFLAERGAGYPSITPSEVFTARYGESTLKETSPFFTHATEMTKIPLDLGQIIMAERLIPDDAKKAMIRLSIEEVPCEIPVYARNEDGTYAYTVNDGDGIPTLQVESTIIGRRLVVHSSRAMYAGNALNFGAAGGPINYRMGNVINTFDEDISLGVVNETSMQSRVYPIMDIEIADEGDYGNRIGMMLEVLTNTTFPAIDTGLMYSTQAFPLSLKMREGSQTGLIPQTLFNRDGDDGVPFILKQNAIDPISNLPVSIGEIILKAYGAQGLANVLPGPIGRVHVYNANVDALLTLLIQGETLPGGITVLGEASFAAEYQGFGGEVDFTVNENRHLLNYFTGIDHKNIPMFSFDVRNSAGFGGLNLEDGELIYATGGDDGLPLDANGRPDRLAILQLMDSMFRQKMQDFGVASYPDMTNLARYPTTVYADSGWSFQTKLAMMRITRKRKDIIPIIATRSIGEMIAGPGGTMSWGYQPKLTAEQERSLAAALNSEAQMSPESVIDGTGATRICIVRGQAQALNPRISGYLPHTFDVVKKIADMAGDTSGNWDGRYSFDLEAVKVLKYIGEIDREYEMTEPDADKTWEAGTNYPLYMNPTQLFWPYLRTVHRESASPMTSLEFVLGTCTAVKEAHRIWAELCGSNLEAGQFVERSNQKLMTALNSQIRFAGKFQIEVETVITSADAARNYSWTTIIRFRSGPYRYVNNLRIIGESSQFIAAAA